MVDVANVSIRRMLANKGCWGAETPKRRGATPGAGGGDVDGGTVMGKRDRVGGEETAVIREC